MATTPSQFSIPLLNNMPLFRLPSEFDNLIIQATLGCNFNQ